MTQRESNATRQPFEPSINHWKMKPGVFKERVTKKQLQSVLLNQQPPIFVQGTACDWKSKHVGVGIYELWVEARP